MYDLCQRCPLIASDRYARRFHSPSLSRHCRAEGIPPRRLQPLLRRPPFPRTPWSRHAMSRLASGKNPRATGNRLIRRPSRSTMATRCVLSGRDAAAKTRRAASRAARPASATPSGPRSRAAAGRCLAARGRPSALGGAHKEYRPRSMRGSSISAGVRRSRPTGTRVALFTSTASSGAPCRNTRRSLALRRPCPTRRTSQPSGASARAEWQGV